jgi:hypothetical protein
VSQSFLRDTSLTTVHCALLVQDRNWESSVFYQYATCKIQFQVQSPKPPESIKIQNGAHNDPISITMMHDDNSSASSGMMFSPVHGRHRSLHDDVGMGSPDDDDGSPLPALQDNSWIGARVSPIPDDMDEDDEEDANHVALYRQALHHSQSNADSTHRFLVANERTNLLGKNHQNIHPLWEQPQTRRRSFLASSNSPNSSNGLLLVSILVGSSGILLGCMAVHDFYLWYLASRRGIEPLYSVAWHTPYLGPSARTLGRFGVLQTSNVQYWRFLTSLFVSTSTTEWILLAWAWTTLRKLGPRQGPSVSWVLVVSIFSTATGQLWMMAFAQSGEISGCASWGMCGILCALGVPHRALRFHLFLSTIALVLINQLQPTSSVWGAIGASFWAWSLAGAVDDTKGGSLPNERHVKKDPSSSRRSSSSSSWWHGIAGGVICVVLWVLPIVHMSVWGNDS